MTLVGANTMGLLVKPEVTRRQLEADWVVEPPPPKPGPGAGGDGEGDGAVPGRGTTPKPKPKLRCRSVITVA